MLLNDLKNLELINPPNFVISNCCYLTIMGSIAYGCSDPNTSDFDCYGICIPPKNYIFPHLDGHILGFGKNPPSFQRWNADHIKRKDNSKEYDLTVFSIIRFFDLCLINNVNTLDSLYTNEDCVLHCSEVGKMIREKRDIFFHKKGIDKFRGYAYSQLKKAGSHNRTGKRKEIVEKLGFDPKFLMHVYRILSQLQQFIETGTLDLQKDKEVYKSIRRGEWSLSQMNEWFRKKEISLQELLDKSSVPTKPRYTEIKELLLNCLEHHYGSLDKILNMEHRKSEAELQLTKIREILNV